MHMLAGRGGIRRGVAPIVAALLLATMTGSPGYGAPAPGSGSGTGQASSAWSSSAPALTGFRAKPVRLTLITGDVVTYTPQASGRDAVTVHPTPGRTSVTFQSQRDKNGFYLFPSDAQGYLAAGALDRELFNLDALATAAGGMAADSQIPVIVQYRNQISDARLAPSAAALPGTATPVALESINGAAVRVSAAAASEFWTSLSGHGSARQRTAAPAPSTASGELRNGLRKVWLDARAKGLDETSTPQVGAPTAWAAGYDGTGAAVGIIDTGIDPRHPDVAGRIRAARNFVPAGEPGGGVPTDVTDRQGHGTHVAGIVAGSGAASGGRHKGVAPGAQLVIGKALNDEGSGSNSAIIEAMEWLVATEHVKVVSMSLGGDPTDGTDPMSQAVNTLTKEHGALFVIAAGNAGPDVQTVAAPGAATSALTVGAVDRNDKLAPFSSRGPRVGDRAIKPEITAPGVDIVAARAAGTTMGTPVDAQYTSASGTSMATPHVAGAAAILARKHPTWTADQLKSALVQTAKPGQFSPYEQGAGRLDIGQAIGQQVFGDIATITGLFSHPYTGQTMRKQVTYRNTGTAPMTLGLSATAAERDGGAPAPADLLSVTPPTVTVPAGGSVTTQVTIEPTAGDVGWYVGEVRASAAGTRSAVPVTIHKGTQQRLARVKVIGKPDWKLHPGYLSAWLVNDDNPDLLGEPYLIWVGDWKTTDGGAAIEATVPLAQGGIYAISTDGMFQRADSPGLHNNFVFIEPEHAATEDAALTFDVRELTPLTVQTPRPSDAISLNYSWHRTTASGREIASASIFPYQGTAPSTHAFGPTKAVRTGSFTLTLDQTRAAAEVRLTVPGRHRLDLHPRYVTDVSVYDNDVPKFDTDRRMDLATEEDLRARRDVRGKVVFTRARTLEAQISVMDLAAGAGAAGVLTDNSLVWVMHDPAYAQHMRIPLLWIPPQEAEQVRAVLADGSRPTAQVRSQRDQPYEYKIVEHFDRIPDDLTLAPTRFSQVESTFHAQVARQRFAETSHTFSPDQRMSIRGDRSFFGARHRTDYYSTTGPDILWHRMLATGGIGDQAPWIGSSYRGFPTSSREREHWNETILPAQATTGPGLPGGYEMVVPCDGCRQGDRMRLRSLTAAGLGLFTEASDTSRTYQGITSNEETHLFRNDTEIPAAVDAAGLPYYPVAPEAATYRLTSVLREDFRTGPRPGGTVETAWTFRSSRPVRDQVAAPYGCVDTLLHGDTRPCSWLPVTYLRYQLGLAPDDTVKAGRPHSFTIAAQQGAGAVRLRSVRAWTSTDGRTWTRAVVTPASTDTYRILTVTPREPGQVSLRVEATDRAGNSVTQTISDAYLVR